MTASVASGTWNDNLGERDWAFRFVTCVLVCALAVIAAEANHRRRERLTRTTALAQRVLDALARPTIGHLDPRFVGMMDEVKDLLREIAQATDDDPHTQLLVAMAWGYDQIFTGRAALLHLGAFTATIMTANVFFIIMPNQRIVVADLKAGRSPDPK